VYTIVHEHFEEIFRPKAPKYGRSLFVLNGYICPNFISIAAGVKQGLTLLAQLSIIHSILAFCGSTNEIYTP